MVDGGDIVHTWIEYTGEDMNYLYDRHNVWECTECGMRAAYLKTDNYTTEDVTNKLKDLECNGVKNVS